MPARRTPSPCRFRWSWTARRPADPHALPLRRRGIHHGWVLRRQRHPVDPDTAWAAADAVFLPHRLRPIDPATRNAIRRTRTLFDRIRGGGGLEDWMWRQLKGRRGFRPAGTSVDVADAREIEKIHVDRLRRGGATAELYAKLSWVSADERDHSLRIRFSFGSERLDDWTTSADLAREADRLSEAVFPETRAITRCTPLRRVLRRLVGPGLRLSERIVYANAPGGGASFHHDAEPGQRGVLYAQLGGRTAWLALPKRELASHVEAQTGMRGVLRHLDHPDPRLRRVLDTDGALTGALAEGGHLHVLEAGDVLLLPSHGEDDACWHAVFALGERPSLAHSYGLFG